MKYEQKFKDFVIKLLNEYRYDVFCEEYSYKVFWEDEDKKTNEEMTANASISVEDVYLHLDISIYPNLQEKWKQKDYKSVKKDLLHEMCHLFTNPISDNAYNLLGGFLITKEEIRTTNERQTQRIANSLWSLNDIIDEKDKEIKEIKKKLKKKK